MSSLHGNESVTVALAACKSQVQIHRMTIGTGFAASSSLLARESGALSSVVSKWRSVSVKEALKQERGGRSLLPNLGGERERSLGSIA